MCYTWLTTYRRCISSVPAESCLSTCFWPRNARPINTMMTRRARISWKVIRKPWESNDVPKNLRQWPRPGFEPWLLDPESSVQNCWSHHTSRPIYIVPENKGERRFAWLGTISCAVWECNPNPKPLLKTAYLRQLFSSSPLEQSIFPSHTSVARRHPPPWQRNMLEGHPQSSSSDSSLHAKSPSHNRFSLTHSPFLHVNCLSLHLKSEKLIESVIFIEKQSGLLFLLHYLRTE